MRCLLIKLRARAGRCKLRAGRLDVVVASLVVLRRSYTHRARRHVREPSGINLSMFVVGLRNATLICLAERLAESISGALNYQLSH